MPAWRSPSPASRGNNRRRRTAPSFVTVGRVVGAFGVAGEVKVDLLTDFPDRFAKGSRLFLDGTEVTVEDTRAMDHDRLLVKLSGVGSRAEADSLRGATLEVPETEVRPLPPGSYYRFQLVGLEAWSTEAERLGTVADVFPTGSTDVLVICSEGRAELLVPNVSGIVDIDLEAGRVTIDPIPGLLPESQRGARSPAPARGG